MITRIDWYILKKFFVTFIFCMLLFTVIAVAVDSSEKADLLARSGLTTMQVMKQYYFGFIPWIWGLLYPLFVFIAVIFFTSRMALRSEVIAIISTGVTYNRWLRPYLLGGIMFAVVLWFANQYGIPRANEIRSNFESVYFKSDAILQNINQPLCTNCFYKRLDSETYAGIKYYDTISKSGRPFFMEKVRGNKVVYNLRAESIQWDTAQKNWRLTNVVERIVDSARETLRQIPTMNLNLSLKPSELRRDDFLKDKLTTPELAEFIRVEEVRATEGLNPMKVELYRRSATPFFLQVCRSSC